MAMPTMGRKASASIRSLINIRTAEVMAVRRSPCSGDEAARPACYEGIGGWPRISSRHAAVAPAAGHGPACAGSVHRNGRTPVGAERERVAGFGKLEDGLRQAGD